MKSNLFFAQLWACEPNYLAKIASVYENHKTVSKDYLASLNLSNQKVNSCSTVWLEDFAGDVSNVEGTARKNGTKQYVRLIPIMGAMFKRADWLEEASGAKGTQQIINDINAANADESITAIVLHIDSGGGTVDGTETIANIVANSKKPIVSFIDGLAASAAYWVASQSANIIASETTAQIGAIGVITKHVDNSAKYQLQGQKVSYLVSQGSENKIVGNDTQALSENDIKMITVSLTKTNEIFINTVKQGRANIASEAFSGDIFMANEALDMGMIDSIGTLQDAVTMALKIANQNKTTKTAMALNTKSEAEVLRDYMQASFDKELLAKDASITALQAKFDEQSKEIAKSQGALAQVANLEKENAELKKVNAELNVKLEEAPKIEASKFDKGDGVLGGKQEGANKWLTSEDVKLLESNKTSSIFELAKRI